MFTTIFSKGSIPLLENILYFTQARHEVLANNIANAETPFYKAIDAPEAEFRQALERAIRERDRRWVPVLTFEGSDHVVPKPGGGLRVIAQEVEDLSTRNPNRVWETLPSLRHDLNNVDLDVEFAKMIKNARLHNAVASILAHQFGVLQEAIRERVG